MISIMVNTYNRSKVLTETLMSLRPFWKKAEIVVVDDFSSDGTESAVKDFVSKNNIGLKYVRNPRNLGYPRSLNVGIENCSNDFVFILNDDNAILDTMDFTEAIESYGKRRCIIATRVVSEVKRPLFKRMTGFAYRVPAETFAGEIYNYTGSRRRTVKYCNNAFGFNKNIGIRFDEKSYIRNAYRIESDFQKRARKKGIKIFYFPGIRVIDKWVNYGGVRENSVNLLLYCIYNHITFLRKNFRVSKYYKIPCYFLLKAATHPYLSVAIIKTFNKSFKHPIYQE